MRRFFYFLKNAIYRDEIFCALPEVCFQKLNLKRKNRRVKLQKMRRHKLLGYFLRTEI